MKDEQIIAPTDRARREALCDKVYECINESIHNILILAESDQDKIIFIEELIRSAKAIITKS